MILKDIHISRRFSLTVKTVFFTLLAGSMVWIVLDQIQNRNFRQMFQERLFDRLVKQVVDDRIVFDNYLNSHHQAVKLFVTLQKFREYVASQAEYWHLPDNKNIKFTQEIPAWLPKSSLLRIFPRLRYALLLDGSNKVREVYQQHGNPLPAPLYEPSFYMLQMSHGQRFMTMIEGQPYLFTADSLFGPSEEVKATLLFASPIDDEFLIAALGSSSHKHFMALWAGEPSQILVSSRPEILPAGTLLTDVRKNFTMIGKDFFDYGGSDLKLRVSFMIANKEVAEMTSSILAMARQQRSILALAILLTALFIVYFIAARIRKLNKDVAEFEEKELAVVPITSNHYGDELLMLEERFRGMTREVVGRTAALEAANSELKDFAYVVSHDLKAPLRAISQLATWIGDDYGTVIDAQGQESLALLISRVKRMHYLIDGILQYSRVGRIKSEYVEIDMDAIVRDVINLIAPPPEITLEIIDKLPRIRGEKVRLEQVIQNLLSNAVKFMDKPEGEITIAAIEYGKFWQFQVKDNGPGINEKYYNKIFQIFQTLTPRDELESAGIGLSIVKKIVELHGGKVWLTSKLGAGSTFCFTILRTAKFLEHGVLRA